MTSDSFKAWMSRVGIRTHGDAASKLGLSVWTVRNYLRGVRSGTDDPSPIPRVVELACAAVEHGVGDVSANSNGVIACSAK